MCDMHTFLNVFRFCIFSIIEYLYLVNIFTKNKQLNFCFNIFLFKKHIQAIPHMINHKTKKIWRQLNMSDLTATGCGCGSSVNNGNNGCCSIIWILLLLSCCGGCGGNSGFFNGGDNNCGCDIIWIILLLSCCGGGNGFGFGCGCGC